MCRSAIDALAGIGVAITYADANLDAQQRLCELFEPSERVFRALRGVCFKGIDMFPCGGEGSHSDDGDEGDGIPTGGGIISVIFDFDARVTVVVDMFLRVHFAWYHFLSFTVSH